MLSPVIRPASSRNNRRPLRIVLGLTLTAFLGCFEPRSETTDPDVDVQTDPVESPVSVKAGDEDGANVRVDVPGLNLDVDTTGDKPEVSADTQEVDVDVDSEGTQIQTDDPDA